MRTRMLAALMAVCLFTVSCENPVAPDNTPATVELTPANLVVLAGGTAQMSVVVKNKKGEVLTGHPVTYVSSDPAIITVSDAGVATAPGKAGNARVTATVGSVSSSPANVTVGPRPVRTLAKQTELPSGPVAGSSHALSVKALDEYGNGVPGVSVSFAFTSGRGSATPPNAATDANGIATTSVKLADSVGINAITATAAGATNAVSFTATTVAGAAAALAKLGTEPATTMATRPVGDSIRVRVTDALGNPKAGVSVAFAVTAGGGSVTPSGATTDADGRAAARFTAGSAVGVQNVVSATVAGIAPVTFRTTTTALILDLTYRTYSSGTPSTPIAVLDNTDSIRVSQFTATGRTGARFTQSAYVDKDRNLDVRVFYDTAGVPSRIYDPSTGEQILINPRDNRVDFLIYNGSGQYVNGIALVADQSKLFLAKIESTPAFTGQINALSNKVSFSLLGKPQSGLGPLVEAPAAFVAFYNENVNKAAASTASFSGMSGAALAAQLASTRALRKSLTQAGLLLIAGGVALPSLGIAAGTVPLGLFAAGVAAIAVGNVPGFGVDALNQLDVSLKNLFQSGIAEDKAPVETASTAIADLLRNKLNNVAVRVGDAARDALAAFLPTSSVRGTTGAPPVGTTGVEGYGVDSNNTLYELSGTVSPSGQVSAGTPSSSANTLNISGGISGSNFNGTYSGTPGNGVLTGSTKPLGECQQNTASGGQGTFTQAFNMGATSGTVSFRYDAFSIPDAFQIATAGEVVFTTGGLVSGSRTVSFALKGSPLVFVTVTAPQSGTAWNFTLGCPSDGSTAPAASRLDLSATSRSFTAPAGSTPAAQTVDVTNGGGGTLSGLVVGSISYSAGASGWLSATLSSSTAPATLTLAPRTTNLSPGTYTATVPVQSSMSGVQNNPRAVTVTLDVTQPTSSSGLVATTLPAEQVGPGGARMRGTTNGGGSSYRLWFDLGTSSSLSSFSSTTAVANTGFNCSNTETCSWFFSHMGLYAGTTYYYRMVAENGAGITRGSVASFTTLPATAPTVSSDSVSLLTASSVRLHFTLLPNGADATLRTDISRNADMSGATQGNARTEPPGNAAGTWFWNWSGLQPGTTYYWRAVVTNSVGTTSSTIRSFTTPAAALSAGMAAPAGPAEPRSGEVRRTSPEKTFVEPASPR